MTDEPSSDPAKPVTSSPASPRGTAGKMLSLPKMVREALGVVWKAAPKVFGATIALQVVGSLTIVVQLLAGRELLGKLIGNNQVTTVRDLIPVGSVLVGAFAVSAIVTSSASGLQHLLAELVSRHAMGRVLEAATTVDLIDFESVDLHDKLQRALLNAGTRPVQMTSGLISVFSAFASSIGIGVALLFISPVLLGLAVVGAIPIWLFGMNSSRSLYQFAVRQTGLDRKRLYLQQLLAAREWAKEVRAYRLGPIMLGRWQRLYQERLDDLAQVLKGRVVRGIAGVIVASIVLGAALAVLLWMVVDGRVALAAAAAAAGAIVLLSRQLQSLANGASSLYESALFMNDFTTFTQEEAIPKAPRRGAHAAIPSLEQFRELAVENVSFSYPTSSRPVLTDVSIKLRSREVIALVGENGSGKSTLAKLIAGLYPVTEGHIRWNDHYYADADLDDIRTNMAVLFQDFIKYQLTASENISLGRATVEPSTELVERAAKAAGATDLLADLPEGLQTQLGPQFLGGTELSGGQWQRVALARAAYRDAAVVILDEPTAALDPLAEAALFDRTQAVFDDKALILISHRFGSVRRADRIYVLAHGVIVEQGNHEQLMSLNGHYAEMFEAQRSSLVGADGVAGSPSFLGLNQRGPLPRGPIPHRRRRRGPEE